MKGEPSRHESPLLAPSAGDSRPATARILAARRAADSGRGPAGPETFIGSTFWGSAAPWVRGTTSVLFASLLFRHQARKARSASKRSMPPAPRRRTASKIRSRGQSVFPPQAVRPSPAGTAPQATPPGMASESRRCTLAGILRGAEAAGWSVGGARKSFSPNPVVYRRLAKARLFADAPPGPSGASGEFVASDALSAADAAASRMIPELPSFTVSLVIKAL